jgi:serpin B
MDREMLLSLVSTIYFKSQWLTKFDEADNTNGKFHAPGGDVDCEFMNSSLVTRYYEGEKFTAVQKDFADGCMWFILPNEGYTPGDLLSDGEAVDFINMWVTNSPMVYKNMDEYIVDLAVPKFKTENRIDMTEAVQSLGIVDCFDAKKADFSLFDPKGISAVNSVEHGAGIAIDEEGIVASAYTVIGVYGGVEIPNEKKEFILDRPFLFSVMGIDGLPLFVGTVNCPEQ